MATSTHWGTTNGYIEYWIEVIQNSQDIAANTSNVTVKVWIERTNTGYTTYGTGTVYCTINGAAYSAGITTSDKITSTPIVLFSKTLDITHDSDGGKTLTVSSSISHSVFDASSHSFSTDLTTIARATVPKLNDSNVNYGAQVIISTPRASGSFTHTLRYNWNGNTGQIASGVATSYTWTVPLSFMNYIPNATASWGTIYCDTYSGGKLIGTKTIRLDTTVPSTTVPTISSVTAVDTATFSNGGVTTNVLTFFGSYIQSISKPKFTINGAAGTYSSTISKYEITFEAVTYSANNSTAGAIKGSGTITVTGKVTDSRGRTATKTATISVLAYAPPKVTVLKIERALSDGTLNAMGTYAKITRAVTWNTLSAKNSLSIVTKSKLRNAATWTTNNTVAAGTSGSYSTGLTISTFDATKSYDFRVEFADAFNTTVSLFVLTTGAVAMSWAAGGIGVGKIWEAGALDVAGDIYLTGKMYGNLGALKVPAGANLDNYVDEGMYYCPLSADAQSMTNVPQGMAFSLLVEKHAGTKQTFTTYAATAWRIYVRNKYGTTWGPWVMIASDGNADWLTLPLQGGAVPYSSGYTPKYTRVGSIVVIQGAISGAASVGTTYATLPSGFRPRINESFGPPTTGTGQARWTVGTDGALILEQVSSGTPTTAWWFPLSFMYVCA